MSDSAGITVKRQSHLLAVSVRYWRWLGLALTAWADQALRPKRRRSWFVFGGCFTWIFLLLFLALAYMLIFTVVTVVVLALVALGVVLSVAGAIDPKWSWHRWYRF